MGLRIIYGRSGTGKTTLCLNEIKQNIEKEEKLLFITPEQFSFNAEKSLVDLLGKNASINAEVLTFKRMAYRVLSEVGKNKNVTLTKSGKAMIIYNILLKQKEGLKLLGKSSTIDGNADIIARSITEFKRHNVCIDDLKNILQNVEDIYLKTKISEIISIYEKFEQSILNNYIDSDDNLTRLANLIEETSMFDNSTIWIDEFNGFTSQEYNIIAKLLRICKNVNISICTDSMILDESKKGIDIFYTSKKTINKLINIANENNVPIENPTYLENSYRFKAPELSHLEKNMFNIPYKIYEKDCNNISIFLAQNPYTEIENIAQNIIGLVKNKGYRYKDISIITKNAEGYSNLINAIFKQYNIPVFMDLESDLSSNILIKYVLSIFDILYKNWSYESVFNYLKTGLVDLEKDDINYLENYVLKWGIRGNTWYKDDWRFGFDAKTDNENEQFLKLNQIRKSVIQPIIEFKEKISLKKTVLEITKGIYEFLMSQNIHKKLDEKILHLKQLGNMQMANEYTLTWNMLMNIFDELVLVLGQEKISFENYKNILRYGLMQNKITTIPSTLDQVIIGDTDRTRSHKVKVMFIIGMIDGVFPTSNNDEGFINDKDRETLAQFGVELAKNTKELLYEDEYNIYKAMSASEEKIFLSFPTADIEGKTLRQSSIISKVKKIFIKINEKSDIIQNNEFDIENLVNSEVTFTKLLDNIRKWVDGEQIDEKWFDILQWYRNNNIWQDKLDKSLKAIVYKNEAQNIDEEKISKLYGKKLKTSVSKLESYKSCAFSYYLKYGLKAKPREEFTIENVDIGTFMHNVIDMFFEEIENNNLKIENITQEDCNKEVEEIVNKILNTKKGYMFSSTAKYVSLSIKLKRVVSKAIWIIISELKNSKFKPFGHEVEFGKSDEFPPIVIKLPNGKEVQLTGKIDRIDIAQDENGKYIRIIDYKSSSKDLNLSNVYYGLQLQLLTYLDASVELSNYTYNPGGVLYFNLSDSIVRTKTDVSEEELEKLIAKQFKMKGLILADVNLFKLMDKNISQDSQYLPIKLNKDGQIAKTSSVATKEQFKDLQKHIKKLLKQISTEILNGNISIKPYWNNKKTPCEYCKYKTICCFDVSLPGNKYNYIRQIPNEEVFSKILTNSKEEED